MASWVEENELLFNKRLNAYKDFKTKDALWESKAATMEKDADILKSWYRSIRTRFTHLVHRKSWDGAADLTGRDRWILTNFTWLRAKKKATASRKAVADSIDDGNDDQSEDPTDTETMTNTHQRLEPFPRRSATSFTKKEEERLLSNIAAREEQFIAFQNKELTMLALSNSTERTRYADLAKEVMVNIYPSLWINFQRDCSSLLYTYLENNEKLPDPATQQQQYSAQQPKYSTQLKQQYQLYPMAAPGTSPTSVMWQQPPQQWHTTAQENMSRWRSQHFALVQGQITGLQPIKPVVHGSSLS
ncbi:hypothetical protein MAR_000984 [Mya arenaria]|uniref:MADF domain-containing protein n=1 Tax=Mya arenaria TaxID=6604 RepID=A0ABY7FEF1_MYAAR|nr:hypothetical protein MAR_000984 [Mya arenaria]